MRLQFTGHVIIRVAIAVFAILAIANPAFAQEAPAPTTLRGVVTSAKDKSPVAGAAVSIASIGAYVFTDAKGEYTIPVTAGTYTVKTEGTGFFPLDKSVTVGGSPTFLDFQLVEDTLTETITIVGSRTPRSQLETSVPVDLITSDVIAESSQTETNQLLNTVTPSYNAQHLAVVDGTDHIDPASLRGLGPEHVLVLVNGKRLHQSALVNIYNGGTVGVDLNAVPTAAIERIEVLRDGAASQYGSDAIAGVINIVLKEGVDLVDLYSMTGITASYDGAQFKLGANTGWKLGKRGFVNVTGEFFARGRTNRSGPWPEDIFPGITGKEATDAELRRRGLARENFRMSVGTSGALVGTSFLNSEYKLSDVFTLHAHGGYTFRQGHATGFYRFPNEEQKVDLTLYPNGFLPEINPRMNAWTASAGLRAKKGRSEGDLSVTHGGDTFRFLIDNSMNASLGATSPTSFDAGRLMFHQTSVNLDGVHRLDLRPLKSVSLVAGGEFRHENYSIQAGEPASYELGPETTSSGDPKLPGAQVFPGFRPDDAVDETRQSFAAYAGIESQPIARINVDLGGRVEHYSDFGNTVIGKAAGRLAVIKEEDNEVALRGAVSTGFRAPGLQQIWYSTIATQFVNDPVTNMAVATNILVTPNESPITQAFGVPQLKEEKSVNFSGGITARLFRNLSLSADYYRVAIKDRVVLSGLFRTVDGTIGDAVQDILDPFPGVTAAQFFINAVDTTTNGVDVVLDYTHRMTGGSLKATAAANFTETTVDEVHVADSMLDKFSGVSGGPERVNEIFLGRYGRNRLEDLLPRQKGTLGLRWDYRGWSVGARANYFGPTEFHSDDKNEAGEFIDESFGAEVTVDLDVGYRIGGLWWSIGGNNVFNNFPDEVQRPENRFNDSFLYTPVGLSAGAPYGQDGAFYYVRTEYKF